MFVKIPPEVKKAVFYLLLFLFIPFLFTDIKHSDGVRILFKTQVEKLLSRYRIYVVKACALL